MHEHGCPYQHHPAGTGGGGGILVLVAVLAALVLAAPQAHTLRPLVDQFRQAGPLPSVALPAPPGASGGTGGRVCPVQGPVRIGQGWGAPRDGGRRRHQGIDLLAPAGTPLVAVADGRITRLSNRDRGRGGVSLRLTDRQGTGYYYAHNQRNLVHLGQRVLRGQVIALVGATGNARGGPPHLHFQLHPGGGAPVNPDALVRRWC
jgi:murein DD-endopeptidase MepM/ murein hydrolase activator NlpD